jgi:hypothetical protein
VLQLFKVHAVHPNIDTLIDLVTFLDDEGVPVVPDLAALPDNLKLHLQLDETITLAAGPPRPTTTTTSLSTTAPPPEEVSKLPELEPEPPKPLSRFTWQTAWNEAHCRYQLNIEKMELKTNPLESNVGMPVLISNLLARNSGVYKFRVIFSPAGNPYNQLSIVTPSEAASPASLKNYGSNFLLVPTFNSNCVTGPDVRCTLDTNTGTFETPGKKVSFVGDIHIGVCLKQGHDSTAKIVFD